MQRQNYMPMCLGEHCTVIGAYASPKTCLNPTLQRCSLYSSSHSSHLRFLHLGIQIFLAVPSSLFCVSDHTLLVFFSRHDHTNSTTVMYTILTAATSNIRIYETTILFLPAVSEGKCRVRVHYNFHKRT
jgi:hypothetical protein